VFYAWAEYLIPSWRPPEVFYIPVRTVHQPSTSARRDYRGRHCGRVPPFRLPSHAAIPHSWSFPPMTSSAERSFHRLDAAVFAPGFFSHFFGDLRNQKTLVSTLLAIFFSPVCDHPSQVTLFPRLLYLATPFPPMCTGRGKSFFCLLTPLPRTPDVLVPPPGGSLVSYFSDPFL